MRAWDSFLARHGALARAIAKNVAPPTADANDVVQEAATALLEQAARTPERFRDPAFARNYFLRTVRNLALREGRRPRPLSIPAEPVSAAPDDPTRDPARRERKDLLKAAVDTLEPEERELLRARFEERRTLKQIATDSGVPISTLHSRERALLRKLRERLDRGNPRPDWEESA